jgi:pyruvate, water dikinase
VSGVLPFGDAACLEVPRAGGKGASLARMTSLGLPVPPGYVVPAEALAAAMPDGGAEVRELARRQDHAAAQELIRTVELDPDLRAAVLDAYAALGSDDPPVAVRSSACAEDSEEASFAGQQETYLHVRGGDGVRARIRDCWASFFSERALFYREQKGSLEDLGMAVVVQRMVEPEKSGVLFTADPVQRRRDRMVLEAVFGLGEQVVSGEVTPDHYVLDRQGEVKREHLVSGGVLDPAEIVRLADLGRLLETHFGGPQDVEWALAGGEIHLLQSRPVTTL